MKKIFIVTDPGKDLDDECTLVLAAALARLGLIEMLGVVAALVPSEKRALLAKGTLKELLCPDVPVGVGSDMRADNGTGEHEFTGVPYMAAAGEVEPGAAVFYRQLSNAPDKSVTLLVIAGMADVADFMRLHEAIFMAKVEQVVIMGGVKQKDDAVELNADGFMVPDSAANNEFDPAASSFVYRRVQELAMPMIVLSREAVYASRLSREVYDKMAATGHPVGLKIAKSQQRMLEDLWRCVNLPLGDVNRMGLPDRFDRKWFSEKYCEGQGLDRQATDTIWDLVKTANLYDPMTLLAALPDMRERFYAPQAVRVRGVDHLVIGVSKNVTGLKNRQDLTDYLSQQLLSALSIKRE